jgi:hypothetical protein
LRVWHLLQLLSNGHVPLLVVLLQPAFYWDWYCTNKTVGGTLPSFLRAFITGWLPNLLLNLWLVMVLPRLVYLLVQVRRQARADVACLLLLMDRFATEIWECISRDEQM